jgi:hypothetical protein
MFNRAGKSGLCLKDYRKQNLYYRYFDLLHPTCEAATERHVRDIFGKLIPLLLVFLAVSWSGTALFGRTAGWFFMAFGLFLGYRAGYPSKGHPVDRLRYERFFYVFAAAMAVGTIVVMLLSPASMQTLSSMLLTRLYPQYIAILPAALTALAGVYLFVKRDEFASDMAYSEWQHAHPERMV